MDKSQKILIVGLGLMGGSYAMALSKAGYAVFAINRSRAAIDWAKKNGLIVDGAAAEEETSGLIADADIVVLALYPDDIINWLTQNRTLLKPGAIITDLCGVKCCFVPEAQNLLGESNEFISCHPMAGKEVSGVQYADDALFKTANFVITPTSKNTDSGIAFAKELATLLCLKHIIVLSIEEHDQMIAYVSQLTHAIAVSLMNANDDLRLPEVTGDSFRDLTRIADINAELWSELFLSNSMFLVEQIDIFTDCLQNLRDKVAAGDKEGLQYLFKQSSERRRYFNKE